MELHQLRYFVAVAEELSFRRAAERLHVCQPPLSRQVRALEEELNVGLLERSRGRRITLTDAGRTLLADARRVLRDVEVIRQHAASAVRGSHEQLVIANNSSISSRLLPACLKRYRRTFPQVEVSLVEMNNSEKFAAISDGRVHIGLFTEFGFSAPAEFESKLLLDVPIMAVMAPGHPLAARDGSEIGVRELDGCALLHPPTLHPSCYTQRIPALCRDADIALEAVRAVEGLENLLAMVAAGYGVAILPDILADTVLDNFRCKRLKLPPPAYQFHAVWSRGMEHPASKNFVKIASQVAAAEQRRESSTTSEHQTSGPPPSTR